MTSTSSRPSASATSLRSSGRAWTSCRNDEKETLLQGLPLDHLANQAKVVEVLLAAGIDKDATRDGGWTALHLCAEHDQRACAKLLLAAGADASVRGSNGMTALRIAEVCHNTAIAKLLRK